MLLQRQQQPVTEVHRRKVKDLAKRLEEGMLKAALSKVFSGPTANIFSTLWRDLKLLLPSF